ncbi:alpha-amylase family glycosyl hydrolase [Alteromonas oceanisediminis]|uniref:alpha-amylase family glycosyl hydrolase n=1 Tax=Alteromonas oceanisediminis TaxID=2836180 RepID=UPI001BDA3112|nr:alpha-amylase family glycosyl hydrolase [Alteromonas oceanisediminis]MBT0585988.1 cyclomaltodextrin glucanotransferase [Alteromonas oceanisediminis]
MNLKNATRLCLFSTLLGICVGCSKTVERPIDDGELHERFVGTQHPFASEAVYFALTDRFVDGDKDNNYPNQGKNVHDGKWHTFDRPLVGPNGELANVGYLGGDFRGVLNNADYIADMGFTAIWLTPVWDNPDQAFSGGETITYAGGYKDGGKTGYHGYWATNFYQADEHNISSDLSFAQFTQALDEKHQLKFVLDIVGNHGSPAYSMPFQQGDFGKLYNARGVMVADHENLHPSQLSSTNPMHRFYNKQTGLAQLSDINENSEAAYEYLINAYRFWLAQGVDAIRIDTIKEMPHHFWKRVSEDIRADYPNLFMFGESFSFDADFIAEHTLPENGGVSVLDFPGRAAMTAVFENPESSFTELLNYLYIDTAMYHNPYELMTFYDNHDMARMNASDDGFINAHNWLFTSRGIPVVYYGAEINFMTGKAEHEGNRNYFGQERIDTANQHPIHQQLTRIANVRKNTPALQRGLQLNIAFEQDTAAFYRILHTQHDHQNVLVLLNKSQSERRITISDHLIAGQWTDAFDGGITHIDNNQATVDFVVPANGVSVLLNESTITREDTLTALRELQVSFRERGSHLDVN